MAELRRSLGLHDAVTIGLGAMIGAGIFAALGPAAAVAGSGLLIGLVLAGVVAYCNAQSTARLATHYPSSGGTYVYGRERLGPFWGYLAGWTFIIGKTASCAAMALTVGMYLWPDQARLVAGLAVLALTAVNYFGVQKSAWLIRLVLFIAIAVLLVLSITALASPPSVGVAPRGDVTLGGVLQSAGLLFFAFAGYARIATLGEEVKDPTHTIPRAVTISLVATLALYALVATAALTILGADALADSPAPLVSVAQATPLPWLVPALQVAAVCAALGALMALILGVSRTTLAMARDGHLPRPLALIHPRHHVPHVAELAVGLTVVVLVMFVDVTAAIGFSSFGVLIYYAVANASAWTLGGPVTRLVAGVGLSGCILLAFSLPLHALLAGLGVAALGVLSYALRRGPTRN